MFVVLLPKRRRPGMLGIRGHAEDHPAGNKAVSVAGGRGGEAAKR